VYVGDTAIDIQAGKSAGVQIGVTYGVADRADIRAAQPDYIIDSFRDMRQFLPLTLPRVPVAYV
jgi:phosphoglycolate phosphatase-like HAD superfamily hydrolase